MTTVSAPPWRRQRSSSRAVCSWNSRWFCSSVSASRLASACWASNICALASAIAAWTAYDSSSVTSFGRKPSAPFASATSTPMHSPREISGAAQSERSGTSRSVASTSSSGIAARSSSCVAERVSSSRFDAHASSAAIDFGGSTDELRQCMLPPSATSSANSLPPTAAWALRVIFSSTSSVRRSETRSRSEPSSRCAPSAFCSAFLRTSW